MLTNWVSSTNHTYLKEPSWDVVLQRQFPDASHTLPWCFSVACQMPSDAFGCLSCVSHVVQITCSCTCSCMLSLAFFWLDLSVKWQVAAYSWSLLNYADNSWEKCFTCLETSVIYNFESRPALLACDTLYHNVSTVIDLCIYILKYTYIYICVYKCMYMTLYMSIRA